MSYFAKMKGTTKSPPGVSLTEVALSWLGSFIGITVVAILQSLFFDGTDLVLMIGSFGASAVLVYGAVKSPLAQPRNLLGGHVLSALIGVGAFTIFQSQPVLAAAAAVATAIAVMHATKTLHPPGGATALIAVIGGEKVHSLGFLYAVVPAGVGAAVLLVVALLFNNIPKGRRYPEFWY
ncbi:MAG TPA: HPP family protein [Desulfomonilaceae bacterium]|nr:HPP family protein [Desulfomonilaceae bacterium]